jgi:methionyl-tRNA formyltransferase
MRILFAGTGDIGIPSLRFLAARHTLVGVLTQPDRPAGRRRELKSPAIKEESIRLDLGVPILQPESPRQPEVISWALHLAPEVMVTMAYGKILPRELLDTPTLACLNIHASLLPRHRGASPIQAAIAAGDHESGVTIMHMAEGLDTGDILLEKRLMLRRRETAGSLSARLAELSPVALGESLDLLSSGLATRTVQDGGLASVTGKIGREETRLDWNRPARELERKIRSLQPRPAAFCSLPLERGGEVAIKVHSAIVDRYARGPSGTIVRSDHRGLLVACGEGGLLLVRIQPEGKGMMRSSDFARGHVLAVGGALH